MRALIALTLFCASAAAVAQSPAPPDKAEALSAAARRGDTAAVKHLLDEGVDVNTKFRYNATALSYACDRGHLELVKLLLDRGADPNVTDTFYNATPLSWAVSPAMERKPTHPEVVRLLLTRGATGKDEALISSIGAPDATTTKVILEVGGVSAGALADALELAESRKRADLVALLQEAGAKRAVEHKMDVAELARFAGTYRNAAGNELIFKISDGKLTGGAPGQTLTFVARDATSFKPVGSPFATFVFRVQDGKVTAVEVVVARNVTTYARVEAK